MQIIVNNINLKFDKEKTLLDILKNNNIQIKSNCNGNCSCGSCLIELEKQVYNLLKISDAEFDVLEKQIKSTEYTRLSCQVLISDLLNTKIEKIFIKVL